MKKENKIEMKIANVYMEKELIDKLDMYAKKDYRKRSDVVRMLVINYIKEQEEKEEQGDSNDRH